jgi:hypothetical protein
MIKGRPRPHAACNASKTITNIHQHMTMITTSNTITTSTMTIVAITARSAPAADQACAV